KHLIFKHAISTVSLPRGGGMRRGPGRPVDRDHVPRYGSDRPHDSRGYGGERGPGAPEPEPAPEPADDAE
ncbi:MAG TPA: hypothetical protein PLF26_04330, partial [Blastocatellia bacterium]|nr:hypothetical protein [Blastocatellia bacterium]